MVASEAKRNVQQHLQGADYPAHKRELVSAAQNNNAPHEFVGRLEGLEDREYSNPDDVAEALESLQEPEEQQPGTI